MIKLLIVDDDEIICRGIATCIDWEAHDIKVVGTVYDGELGLDMARRHQPDIMLVDINMPFMDGLELAYAVRQEFPAIKIILLTAYKEFAYAQRAVELQVFNYLSKPFLNEDVLQAVLDAKQAVVTERSYRREIEENQELIRQKYLSQIVLGQTQNPDKIRWCGLEPEHASYRVGVLMARCLYPELTGAGPGEALLAEEVALRLVMDETRLVLQRYAGASCFSRGERVVLLFSGSSGDVSTLAEEVAGELLRVLAGHDDYYACMGLGRPYTGAASIHHSYEEAQNALEYHYYHGNNSLIRIEEVEHVDGGNQMPFRLYREQLLDAVRQGDAGAAGAVVAQLFGSIRESRQYALPAVAFLAAELLVAAFKATGDEELYAHFIEGDVQGLCALHNVGSIGEVQRMMERGLARLFETHRQENTSEPEQLAARAVRYIEENYMNPDLSLKMVADHVHISTSYLCVLFRQLRQTSYVSYLNKTRMENAKRLLQKSNIKTYEVAFKVGYNSSQYFASSFKKYTGQTPGAFRSTARGL